MERLKFNGKVYKLDIVKVREVGRSAHTGIRRYETLPEICLQARVRSGVQ